MSAKKFRINEADKALRARQMHPLCVGAQRWTGTRNLAGRRVPEPRQHEG